VIDSNENVVSGGENIGYVDYESGTITINTFYSTSTEIENTEYPEFKGRIKISGYPYENVIFTIGNQVLDILPSDISVNAVSIQTLI
jgi:hypothetical protein